jgi:hypothetical protein
MIFPFNCGIRVERLECNSKDDAYSLSQCASLHEYSAALSTIPCPIRFPDILVYNDAIPGCTDMKYLTDDLRIKEIKELLPPARLLGDVPITETAAKTVYETRQAIHRILHGADDCWPSWVPARFTT